MKGLGCTPQRPCDRWRKLDKNEPSCRVKIIFTTFIDDTKVTIAGGIFVGDNSIDLV
jgi:hypothetical protein